MTDAPQSAHQTATDDPVEALRKRLGRLRGRELWHAIEELAESPALHRWFEETFPRHSAAMAEAVNRRQFIQLAAASLALAGLGGCTSQPREHILPYVNQPEMVVPGHPRQYATALTLGGLARGALVETHTERPTKIEGNPLHPASLGATDLFMQADVLSLYDPERATSYLRGGVLSSPDAFISDYLREWDALRANGGAGLRLLTGAISSPTLTTQIQRWLDIFPAARWHWHEPAHGTGGRLGAQLAFGRDLQPVFHTDAAEVIVALDADFLTHGPAMIPQARGFIDRRRMRAGTTTMNRLHAIESNYTATGAMADERLPLRPARIPAAARYLADRLGVASGGGDDDGLTPFQRRWLDRAAADLRAHAGRSLLLAGEYQPAAVHALAYAINQQLGNFGTTITMIPPPLTGTPDPHASLAELAEAIDAGEVDTLIMLGGNPVYSAPADLDLGNRLLKVRQRVYWSLYHDETASYANWFLPAAHELEGWSDARAFDGSATIVQPLIAPLYNGWTPHELLAILAGEPRVPGQELIRRHWSGRLDGEDPEEAWRRALHDGIIANSASHPEMPPMATDLPRRLFEAWAREQPAAPETLEIIFRPDPTIWDGRYANNGWLQECPKPMTRLTWSNAALIAPATADRLGLANRDIVELELDGRVVEAPIWVLAGHAPDCVTVHLGYGRRLGGRVGAGHGFSAYEIRATSNLWQAIGARLRRIKTGPPLAAAQYQIQQGEREFALQGNLENFRDDPEHFIHLHHAEEPVTDLYPEGAGLFKNEPLSWGMSIDLTACVGCNACVVACVAENNVPVVGEREVVRGREMHWLRIDHYIEGPADHPATIFQPMLCQHCEKAPCEYVCPVKATVHDEMGLNVMVYNRCIGTRYCSNNCPYKVRRFNFLSYANENETRALQYNPDVTVRMRGVMEKCTFCIQRISRARIDAKNEGRPVRDGEVTTACQSACPTRAIEFGNLNDPESRVVALKQEPHAYGVLEELNTFPRISYLARVRNPAPAAEEDVSPS